ncbi:MAG: ParB/RepB/Spo0J family partition protein [Planctomycetota bacterium]
MEGVAAEARAPGWGDVRQLRLEEVAPRADQPREHFDAVALETLAASIRADGLIQPIAVREVDTRGAGGIRYEIVAGERRWRACGLAGLETIGAVVLSADELRCDELALIENIQREDLGPIEKGRAFQRLSDHHGLSHAQIAERVGLRRPTISNFIRLLELGEGLQQAVASNQLTMGHARALLAVAESERRNELGQAALQQGWSVRKLEQEAQRTRRGGSPDTTIPTGNGQAVDTGDPQSDRLAALAQQVSEQVGARVTIREGRKKNTGSITLEFFSLDEFDALIDRLGVKLDV